MPQDISGATLLKVSRLSSQMNSKRIQTGLLKVVFEFPYESNSILQNGHKLKGSGVLSAREPYKRTRSWKKTKNKVKHWREIRENCNFSGGEASTDNDLEATLGAARCHLNRLQI